MSTTVLDFEAIKKLIPQRFPYIMIDRILSIVPGQETVASKNVSGNDIFFLGHFPEKAIMPGTAIIEAMAQAAVILFAMDKEGEISKKALWYIGSIKARFLKAVVPGDQLIIKVMKVKSLQDTAFVSAEAFVDEAKVSTAELVFSVEDET